MFIALLICNDQPGIYSFKILNEVKSEAYVQCNLLTNDKIDVFYVVILVRPRKFSYDYNLFSEKVKKTKNEETYMTKYFYHKIIVGLV